MPLVAHKIHVSPYNYRMLIIHILSRINSELSDRHGRRGEYNCIVTAHKKKFYENSPLYYCSKIWNSLANVFKCLDDVKFNFREGLYMYFVDKTDVYIYY